MWMFDTIWHASSCFHLTSTCLAWKCLQQQLLCLANKGGTQRRPRTDKFGERWSRQEIAYSCFTRFTGVHPNDNWKFRAPRRRQQMKETSFGNIFIDVHFISFLIFLMVLDGSGKQEGKTGAFTPRLSKISIFSHRKSPTRKAAKKEFNAEVRQLVKSQSYFDSCKNTIPTDAKTL